MLPSMFRRNHRKSDTDLRGRRSLEALRSLAHARSSEQISRNEEPPPPIPQLPHVTTTRPPSQHGGNKRFSMLRSRNASDSQIGLKARDTNQPPVPTNPPAIITTAPTNEISTRPTPKRSGTVRLWRTKGLGKGQSDEHAGSSHSEPSSVRSSLSTRRLRDGSSRNNSNMRLSVTFDEPAKPYNVVHANDPPPYEDQNTSLHLPGPRLSESSRSTASSGDHTIACSTTTTTHTTTTTTFFRLPRRKKKEASLFPLPIKLPAENYARPTASDPDLTPQARRLSTISTRSTPASPSKLQIDGDGVSHASTMLAASSLGFSGPGAPILRSNSAASVNSVNSSPTSHGPRLAHSRRGRSSTLSSLDPSGDIKGRNSFGGLLGRIRRESEPMFGGPVARNSSPQPQHVNSVPGSRGTSHEMHIPERHDEDTPPIYLSKLFEAVSKSVVASLLARNGDPFHLAVLKVYMETFDFESDPMDMALRKLLMEVELPAETQQIDRVLQAFADRYHECNPFIYQDSDQAYYVAFSLIMLHTDFFNKNNKHKMQKADYVKNTLHAVPDEGIANDILECFYHNITYTPFIRMEDEFDINGEKIVPHRPKRGIFHRTANTYDGRRIREPVDPYTLIIDNQLDLLRPSLKDVLQLEDPYAYSGTASRLDMTYLHRAFFRSGMLQIVSARSRPDAFMTATTLENPDGADPGVVEIKVTKVGLLWRKELKKKTGRSPWHEWGAILTGSQLYFFRNIAWIKNLMHQYDSHHKHGSGTPVIFKPPLEQFKPDAQISTDDAVALLDKSYKKHKNTFAFIRHGGIQEYFIADSEGEMNDWLAKLNYAATFRTAGVRMRGVVGGTDAQRIKAMRRVDGNGTPISHVQTPSGEVSIVRGGMDAKLASEITAARREVIERRIIDSEDRIAIANRQLQTYLRNARHLMILAPIQPRTREQVVMAAATLAAKLQWVRMDMWKMRCHRDILALDMEEERKASREQVKQDQTSNTLTQKVVQKSPLSFSQGSSSTADVTSLQSTFNMPHESDLSHVPSQASGTRSSLTPGDRRQHSFDFSSRASIVSALQRSPSDTSLIQQKAEVPLNGTDDQSIDTSRSYHSPTPTRSESSFGGDQDKEKDERQKGKEKEKEKEKEKGKGKEKDPHRTSIRKSFQRTLRDPQGITIGHRRGRSKDLSSEDGSVSDKKPSPDEGLTRGSGSFTVHGKKASIANIPVAFMKSDHEKRPGDPDGAESLSSMLSYSRRGSQTTVAILQKEEASEERSVLLQTNGRRVSHQTVPKDKEECVGVPKDDNIPTQSSPVVKSYDSDNHDSKYLPLPESNADSS